MPEDEPQFGSLWEHIVAGGKGVLNYGEGLEIEGNAEIDGAAPEGQRLLLNSPLLKPIFESTDRNYPTFNLGIPDQYRVAEFERDFRRRLRERQRAGLIVIRLPDDHTADPRPKDGYPYRASYVADNDLALGRIVEFLSQDPDLERFRTVCHRRRRAGRSRPRGRAPQRAAGGQSLGEARVGVASAHQHGLDHPHHR